MLKMSNRATASRGTRLAAVVILLALCFQFIAVPAAKAETPEYGGMTLKEVKQARVYPGTLDSVYTLSTWEFEEQEDVPYVSLKEYLNLLFVDTYAPGLDFSWEGDVLQVTRNDTSMRVNPADQTVSVDDMCAFLGPHAAGALDDGIVEKTEFIALRPSEKNESTQTPAEGYEVKLGDYGVEMLRVEDDVLIPFCVAQSVFAAPAMRAFLAYNGDDYYDIVNSVDSIYGMSSSAPNPYANMWYSGSFASRTALSEAYAKYNYAGMCILLDLTYGHKEEKGITDFDSYLEENGMKDALLSTDPKDDVDVLKKLFGGMFDSGHDAEILSPSIIDSEGAIEKAEMIHEFLEKIGYESLAELGRDFSPLFYALLKLIPRDVLTEIMSKKESDSSDVGPNVTKMLTDMIRMQILKPLSFGSGSRVDIVGDTCVIYFEGFEEDLTRSESFYTKLPTKDDLDSSSFGLFYYAFEKIKANGNVKNVVIDLSNNGGGSAAALVSTLGFLSKDGEVRISYRDLLNQNYRVENYHVDTNLDGRFDDQDGYGGQYKFYVLTNGTSYSCANAFPYFAQQQKLAKVIGEKPGGGDCVVAYYIDAYGHVGAISGAKQLGIMEGDVFTSDESAVEVDIPFVGNEGDDIYFHPDKIAQFIADRAA
ncbi:MAG: S41 family peptidase [Oscillospiraceae bacterium]|nr:S41 family peptidase [Oscillospiraceae bacterium]